jgi:uncharacterized protein YjiS (DUF1127 family)
MTTIQNLRQTVSRFVDGQRKRSRLRHELAQLAAMGCLDEVLADAGLVREQIESLIAGCADNEELLDQMLARLGIDAAELPAGDRRDMTWTCTTCPDKRRCREWLSGTEQAGFRVFCPNAARLDDAMSGQPPLRDPLAAISPDDDDFRPGADELRRMRAEESWREARALLEMARMV